MRLHQSVVAVTVLLVMSCGGGDSGGGPTTPGTTTTGTVRGNVSDQNGAAVANAGVALTGTGSARNTTTGGDGAYTFTAVAPGAYTVTVTPPTGYTLGTSTGITTVSVVAGAQASASAIVLNRTSTGGGPPPQTVNVSMVNTSFSPAQIAVNTGDSVRFTNNDNTAHNATGNGISTGNLSPGQNASVVMSSAGTFNYSCTLHAFMTGQIVVR